MRRVTLLFITVFLTVIIAVIAYIAVTQEPDCHDASFEGTAQINCR